MYRLIWKALPYLLVALGLLLSIRGIGIQFEDVPNEPTPIAASSLLSTSVDDMPGWVQVDGGLLYWLESIEIYTERSNESVKEIEHVYVPLVDEQIFEAWQSHSIRDADPVPTCVLVQLDRQTLRDQFPDYLDDPTQLAEQLQPYALSFTTRAERSKVGVTGRMLDQFRDVGFREFVIAEPGSDPMTKKEGVVVAGVGALFCVTSVFWIVKRRKSKSMVAGEAALVSTAPSA